MRDSLCQGEWLPEAMQVVLFDQQLGWAGFSPAALEQMPTEEQMERWLRYERVMQLFMQAASEHLPVPEF